MPSPEDDLIPGRASFELGVERVQVNPDALVLALQRASTAPDEPLTPREVYEAAQAIPADVTRQIQVFENAVRDLSGSITQEIADQIRENLRTPILNPIEEDHSILIRGAEVGLNGAPIPEGNITFNVGGGLEVLRFTPDGKIFVQGRLVEEDREVVNAMRWWVYRLASEPVPNLDFLVPPAVRKTRFTFGEKLMTPDGPGDIEGIFPNWQAIPAGLIQYYAPVSVAPPRQHWDQIIYYVRSGAQRMHFIPECDAEGVVPDYSERQAVKSAWERIRDEDHSSD